MANFGNVFLSTVHNHKRFFKIFLHVFYVFNVLLNFYLNVYYIYGLINMLFHLPAVNYLYLFL